MYLCELETEMTGLQRDSGKCVISQKSRKNRCINSLRSVSVGKNGHLSFIMPIFLSQIVFLMKKTANLHIFAKCNM